MLLPGPSQAELFAEELLPADQAFIFSFKILPNKSLQFDWQIAPGYYLYKDQFKLLNTDNTSLLNPNMLPTGIKIQDKTLGNYMVYANDIRFTLAWDNSFSDNSILLTYQGCAKSGFCYAPVNKQIYINSNMQAQINDTNISKFNFESISEQLSSTIKNKFLPMTLIIFFLLGILLSFTPCVLPMVPLVVNLIIGPKQISSHKALILASTYVAGMAGSYALAGIFAGLLGATLQVWMQQPIILILLSCLLVLLALNQFELIKISLPHFNSKLHHWGQKNFQGSLLGAFILGILSALIVSPCITPPLIGILTYISQDGNPVIGALTLLSLGLGMGTPLIIVAVLSSIILPKVGPWMSLIKSAAGIALLGLAIWILARIVSLEITLMLWGGLCIITAVLFNAFKTARPSNLANTLLRMLGILLALFGTVLIVGSFCKAYNLYPYNKHQTTQHKNINKWQAINSMQDLNKYLAIAKIEHKPTILEFYADWCTTCRKIELSVFTDPTVQKKLAKYQLLRVDITDMSDQQNELMQSLKVYGPPAILFFDAAGDEITGKRLVGNVSVQDILQ